MRPKPQALEVVVFQAYVEDVEKPTNRRDSNFEDSKICANANCVHVMSWCIWQVRYFMVRNVNEDEVKRCRLHYGSFS